MATTSKGIRYPTNADSPAGPAQMQNLASDVDTRLFYNGGHAGAALAGSVPSTGTALIFKTWTGQIITNASGDYTMFPPLAFTNGLLSVSVICATGSAQPFFFTTSNHALTSVVVRAYNITSASVAASLSITATATWIGW